MSPPAIPTGAQRSGGTRLSINSKETRVPHPSRVGVHSGRFLPAGVITVKGGLKSFCHPWSPGADLSVNS